MKTDWRFSLESRTNLIAAVTFAAGAVKMFYPEAPYDGDPLQLMSMGAGMIYLREAVGNVD